MGEADAIDRVDEPVTMADIEAGLRELGVTGGETLLVHASLSALGWVSGGAQTVVEALLDVVRPEGTLVMPTHSGQYTDPADWENPPIPDDWVETVRETRPAFDPERTPTREVGAIPETFRSYPGVKRSEHPIYSFAATGANATQIVGDHPLDYGLGPDSPLGSIYELDGSVLLLGTTHETNTSIHLAEYLATVETPERTRHAPIRQGGERVGIEYRDIELKVEDFAKLGADFEADVGSTRGQVGAADVRLVDQRTLVEYAVGWFERNR
jgi:aminoglycoside 3-N-acetyltransferase